MTYCNFAHSESQCFMLCAKKHFLHQKCYSLLKHCLANGPTHKCKENFVNIDFRKWKLAASFQNVMEYNCYGAVCFWKKCTALFKFFFFFFLRYLYFVDRCMWSKKQIYLCYGSNKKYKSGTAYSENTSAQFSLIQSKCILVNVQHVHHPIIIRYCKMYRQPVLLFFPLALGTMNQEDFYISACSFVYWPK